MADAMASDAFIAATGGALTWLAPALVPLAAMLLLLPALRRLNRLRLLLPLAALPALGVALFAAPGAVDLPWLFLGARFGLDGTGRIFLLFTSALWLAGGVHALGYLHDDPRRNTFWLFWCAAMAGNFGLVKVAGLSKAAENERKPGENKCR